MNLKVELKMYYDPENDDWGNSYRNTNALRFAVESIISHAIEDGTLQALLNNHEDYVELTQVTVTK